MLIRSEKSHKENNYLEYITKDRNNEIHHKINEIKKELVMYLSIQKKKNQKELEKDSMKLKKRHK